MADVQAMKFPAERRDREKVHAQKKEQRSKLPASGFRAEYCSPPPAHEGASRKHLLVTNGADP